MIRETIAAIACVGLFGCGSGPVPLCNDGVRNGDETDVDCGGTCGPCEDGGVHVDADVDAPLVCGQTSCAGRTCPLPSCFDGIRDGQETDVDCGGGICRKCAGARHCTTACDCFNGQCIAGTCSSLLTVSFADAVRYASGFKPYAIMSGDLDADGDLDLAVANEIDSTVSVFRNTGQSSGMFVRMTGPTMYGFPTAEYPTGGAIADFNRDGIADVITADYHGNSVSILLGTGTGATYSLTARSSYPTVTGAETSNLATGDLNGDAILDVIATNPQRSSVSVFIGRADGTLSPAINVACGTAGNCEPYSVAIGDFDGNGTNDAAIADNRSGTIYIKLGNGDGTFHPGPSQPMVDGTSPYNLVTRDMDLDGNLDLVVANRDSDNVSVLLGHGNGNFGQALVSSTGPNTGPYSVAVTDFNLDGVPDIVTANFMSGTATVLLGIGDGRFEAAIDAGSTGMFSYGVATGDFNGDGKPDIAIANASLNVMEVKMSTAH
ncbi:MAG: Tryptophan synthase alpha chain [Myxococcales bacterium]|nr:Tryptophan synthase alpha chain [Myxococcales bacterium]